MSHAEREFRSFAQARSLALLRTAYLITGDHQHAEDLVQTTLAKVFVAWPRIRDKTAAEAYTRRTLVTTYTSWRRQSWWQERATGEDLDRPPRSDLTDDVVAERDRLWQVLQTLPRQQRAVVVLRFVEDLPVDEVARLLRITSGSVKTHTSRALAALRVRLDAAHDIDVIEGGTGR